MCADYAVDKEYVNKTHGSIIRTSERETAKVME